MVNYETVASRLGGGVSVHPYVVPSGGVERLAGVLVVGHLVKLFPQPFSGVGRLDLFYEEKTA
jgi:hypothetical protein